MPLSFCSCAFRYQHKLRYDLYFRAGSVPKGAQAGLGLHGSKFTNDVRVVLGHGIPTKDGNIREKAVDALLVADLIYHAASRNCDYAILVSVDTDFAHAIKRVEDFGCRTCTVGVCCEVPDRLKNSSDRSYFFREEEIIGAQLAKKLK